MTRVGVFLIPVALVVRMAGCIGGDGSYAGPPGRPPFQNSPPQNLEIWTWYDLDAVRDNLAGNHTLMNDLDSTASGYWELASPTANQGKGWEPIGIPFVGLRGTLDGQGYDIRDLFINRPDEDCVGLFGDVDRGGIIKNVGVVNVTVTGEGGVGGLVGENWGTVSNCYCTGNVTGDGPVGGLVGANDPAAAVSNSYFTGSVTGGDSVGGLLGTNSDGSVSNSYSTGNVTGYSVVGGLAGENLFNAATVSNSYSACRVTGYEFVGGLVGENTYRGTVNNCYSTSNVTGNDSVGGLVGENTLEGTVSNSYSTGSVSGNSTVGGLVGRNTNATVSDSYWDIETSGQAGSAGVIGRTTAQMQDIDTFSGAAWSIVTVANRGKRNASYIWNIVDGLTYPFLSWQP